MANVKLVFSGTEKSDTQQTELTCYLNSNNEIYLQMESDGFQYMCLDKSTAIKFAKTIEPTNQDLESYSDYIDSIRLKRLYSTPTRLDTELKVNPFLRTEEEEFIISFDPKQKLTAIERLASLRKMKNSF